VTARRLGVEEELLLTDMATGALRPVSREVITACTPRPGALPAAQVKHELFLSQVELASLPRVAVAELRAELADARAAVAAAAAELEAVPLAVPGPVLAPVAAATVDFSPGERYARIERHYGNLAQQSLMCALHVHVEVADDHEAVAVVDRMRPWIPVLVALSANSPYWHGLDTGYESWRSRVWNLWPTGGPAELFHDPATYHRVVHGMVRRGAALDVAMVNLDVRVSNRFPTVEFRVADVCTDLGDAMVVAALARALVEQAARTWRDGAPPESWRIDELRAAAWRAARFGLVDSLVCPESHELAPAGDVLGTMLNHLGDCLADAGDLELVQVGLTDLAARGTGAGRQRAARGATGGLAGVLADLQARTLAP
jgi:carboxylate-amine ligase